MVPIDVDEFKGPNYSLQLFDYLFWTAILPRWDFELQVLGRGLSLFALKAAAGKGAKAKQTELEDITDQWEL